MNIIIASDSFKGTLSSKKVNAIIESSIIEKYPQFSITKVSIADGGEGTVEAITDSLSAHIKTTLVSDALCKKNIEAKWAIFNNGCDAIMEVASVVGLNLLDKKSQNPCYTSTYGIGELILEILKHNVKNIYIGLGGSSTNDAGTAAVSALGIKFLDSQYNPLPLGGVYLNELAHIDISNLNPLIKSKKFILLNDVQNILCGKEGASFIFATQKGATAEEVILLDNGLNKFQEILKKDLSIDVSTLKGGGAAGGIAAGFFAFLCAELKSGIESLLELINFNSIISKADLIITGEGKIDDQTKYGKTITGITSKAKNIPVIAFCAILDGNKEKIKKDLGLKNIFSVINENVSIDMSLENAEKYLRDTVTKNLKNITYIGL